MLFELNLSHLLAVYPEDMKRYMPVQFAGGEIGANFRLLDGEAVIRRAREDRHGCHAALLCGV
jgi:hypothetical protein